MGTFAIPYLVEIVLIVFVDIQVFIMETENECNGMDCLFVSFYTFETSQESTETLSNPLNSKKTSSSCICSASLTTIPIFKRLYISA